MNDGKKGESKQRIPVPCTKCPACLTNKRQDWFIRLKMETKKSISAYFVTLTYSDDNLPFNDFGLPELRKRDLQLFMKKFRKTQKNKIRFYAVGEYGTKYFRPHYHLIIWNCDNNTTKVHKDILETWNKGRVDIGPLKDGGLKYVTGYIIQKAEEWTIEPPFAIMSQGIGKNYIDTHTDWHQADLSRNYVVLEDGKKARLPKYYREKIYSKADREEQTSKYLSEQSVEAVDMDKWWDDIRFELDRKRKYKKRIEKTIKQNAVL